MTRVGAFVPPRTWGGVALALAVLLLVGAGAAPAHAEAPTGEPSPATSGPDATCELTARRGAQVVACVVTGMAPDAAVALTVVRDGEELDDAAVGGATTGEDGTARVEAGVPCEQAGSATVEVAGASADGGRFRHVEPVTLDGACLAPWELTSDEWATVMATMLVVAAAAVVIVAWRRRVRRRRRRRGVSSRPHGRSRPRTQPVRGRRRSPRRRTRRR